MENFDLASLDLDGTRGTIILFSCLAVALILLVWALRDLFVKSYRDTDRIFWAMFIICIPILGSLAYFIFGTRNQLKYDKDKKHVLVEEEEISSKEEETDKAQKKPPTT
jgi:hypothetical protein